MHGFIKILEYSTKMNRLHEKRNLHTHTYTSNLYVTPKITALSVRLDNCKGCSRPFANIGQTASKYFFYKFLISAFKSCALLIHLNKFAPGYPEKKIFHFSLLQSVSSKRAGHTVAFDFASQGFLAFHIVTKKAFKFCASVV